MDACRVREVLALLVLSSIRSHTLCVYAQRVFEHETLKISQFKRTKVVALNIVVHTYTCVHWMYSAHRYK